MNIKIAERLRPFSHVPGTTCLIPHSSWQVQVFPTLLRFQQLPGKSIEYALPFRGPVRDFTVELDLEKGWIHVFGQAPEGHMRYRIVKEEEGIVLIFDKTKQRVLICKDKEPSLMASKERLSLGMHRSQDWELVRRRHDLAEIFPIWLRLSQLTPKVPVTKTDVGTLAYLKPCTDKMQVIETFLNFFDAAFHGILAPRLSDDQFQGLTDQKVEPSPALSPLPLVTEGGVHIRSLFFQEAGDEIALLPCLPPEFHSGRFVNLKLEQGDEIDIEWSKKLLRRVILRSKSERTLRLRLQKPLQTFRLRTSLKDRGTRRACDEPLSLRPGQALFLDRFQK